MPAYSGKAQPFLDAIANSIFRSSEFRDWIIQGTSAAESYQGASVLHDEQRDVRWKKRQTKQPFWANYWCGLDSKCTCRIEGSKGLESDAIFFLRNTANRILAVHVEFKHSLEPFQFGQPDCYPLRAKCFSETHSSRDTLNAHDDWITVLFCGDDALSDDGINNFCRVITHSDAAQKIPTYPTHQVC